ncbi:MAG: cation transporter [Deltaproteobacteria bacterium]|nr:cation transporter [Deltaproteobacteria bacterium]
MSKTEPLKSGANALRFERLALKITGFAFYVLAIGLFLTSFLNIYFGRKPETTLVGIIVSIISIATMAILFRAKVNVGKKLGSDAIVADAHCTRACMYLSLVLLLSSAGYELLGFGFIDSIGAAGIGYHALREGKEALEKRVRRKLKQSRF